MRSMDIQNFVVQVHQQDMSGQTISAHLLGEVSKTTVVDHSRCLENLWTR